MGFSWVFPVNPNPMGLCRTPLIPDMVHAIPALHGLIQSVRNNSPVGFQSFDQAALAGAVVADQDSSGVKDHGAAVVDGLEVFQLKSAFRKGPYFM